jgi:Ser/Thr protein kinase RdoA (MazF antagonist)
MNIGAINQEECRTIAKAFESIYRISRDVRASLLHGDLGHHNVFSDGQHITAIIDWEDCLCGDPVFDIAFWGTFCRDYMLDPFLKGYRTIRQLPGDFELRYWLYYLRIALSKTVHRFRFGYPDRPGRPPASLRIQKAVEKLRSLGCC